MLMQIFSRIEFTSEILNSRTDNKMAKRKWTRQNNHLHISFLIKWSTKYSTQKTNE